jgi:threonine dehydrogenase-like Zn-dependent dehydrogenase
MIERGRLKVLPMVARVVSPKEAPEIYDQLCDDPKFPMGTVFDWSDV